MTTINNDDFKVIEKKEKEILDIVQNEYLSSDEKIKDLEDYGKNFPEIEDSVKDAIEVIRDTKKAPAKKTPAKKRINNDMEDYSYETEREAIAVDERAEAIDNAITTLQRNADAQKQLISSVNEKNNTLQEKLDILDVDCVKVVIPNHTLKAVVTRQIMRVNHKLADSVDEVNEVIEKLYADDIQEALKQVSRINDLKNRICDLEDVDTNRLDYLDDDIENAVQNELSNCYYVERDDVESMIDDSLCDYVERSDLEYDLKIYGREINELRERLNNTLYNKTCRLFKSIFSYNLSNKVRSIFKRNKRKKIDLNEINERIKASKK